MDTDRCARCGIDADPFELVELPRFGPGRELVIEHVCDGCCKSIESTLARCDDREALMAFSLALFDAFERMEAHRTLRALERAYEAS